MNTFLRTLLFLVIFFVVPCTYAQEEGGPDLNSFLDAGRKHMEAKEWKDAVDDFKAALLVDPKQHQIHNILGMAYLQQGNHFNKALTSFEEAIRLKPDYAEAYFNIGLGYAQYRQDPKSASEYFEKSLEYDPRNLAAYHGLGMIYLSEEHDPYRALGLFEKSIELKPDFAQGHFGAGMSYVLMGKPEKSLGAISALRALGEQQLALTLESMIRGEGSFLQQTSGES